MQTSNAVSMAGDSASPFDPRNFRQVYNNGTQYVGIETSDMSQYPLASGVTSSPQPVLTNYWNGSVTFTADFFGTMAFTPNTFQAELLQGTVRTHDSFTRWSDIETSEGVYNPTNLGYLDYLVNTAAAQGKKVMYTVYKTPAWAAVGGDVNAPPANMTKLANWLTFLYNRYGTKIAYYEGWNEPNISGSFVGNMAALVSYQQTIYNTLKGLNSNLKIITPSFGMKSSLTADTLNLAAFLSAGGAAYGDWIGFHPYRSYTAKIDTLNTRAVRLEFDRTLLPLVRAQLDAAGVLKPINSNECGSSTPSEKTLLEMFIYSAAYANMALAYSWDAIGYEDMRLSRLGVDVWNSVVNRLLGKTLIAINNFSNGDFAAVFSDGTSISVTY